MATKKVGYVEPSDYFNAAMLKAAREYDAEQKKKAKAAAKKSSKKK